MFCAADQPYFYDGIWKCDGQRRTKLNRTKVTLLKGEKTTLKVTGTRQKVAWRSSKKSVATVNSKGQVVAKNKGSATIYAKVSKKTYKCVVKVETPKLSKEHR